MYKNRSFGKRFIRGRKVFSLMAWAGLAAGLAMEAGCGHDGKPVQSVDKDGGTVYQSGDAKRTAFVLPDGTEVLMNAGTVLRVPAGFGPGHRELTVEGEALFRISAKGGINKENVLFIIHTRALVTEVLMDSARASAGPFAAECKVNGFPKSPGEEVDLVSGRLRVRKSYHSTTDNEPEFLRDGEMVMVNTDIDLMEKEKFKPEEVKEWEQGKDQ